MVSHLLDSPVAAPTAPATRSTGGEPPNPTPNLAHKSLRLLLLEDQLPDAELCLRELKRAGINLVTHRVDTRAAFEAALQQFSPDLIISDFSLPDAFDGLAALDLAQGKLPEVPFVFVSGTIGEERAVEAMKRGATDYVLKDKINRLVPVIRRAIQEIEERAARRRAEEDTARQRAFLRQVIDLAPIFIFATDRDGRFALANQAMADAYGTTVEQLLGKTDADFNADANQVRRLRQTDLKVIDTLGEEVIPEETITDAAGRTRRLHTIKRPIVSEDGTANMVLGVSVDITDLKEQENRIARLSRFRAVLSGINATIVRVTDRDQLLQEACRIAVDEGHFLLAWIGALDQETRDIKPVAWHGLGEGLVEGLTSSIRDDSPINPGTTALAARSRASVIVNDIANDPRVNKKAGVLGRGLRALAALPLMAGGQLFGVFKLYAGETGVFDREEVKLLEELAGNISFALDHLNNTARMHYLAYYDSLTGLPNRELFDDRLVHAISSARQNGGRIALVIADVKRFRLINETIGRHAGDALLREISRRLLEIWPAFGNVARISTNSFAGLITDFADASEVANLVEKPLARTMGIPFEFGGTELTVELALGIAVFPGDGENAETLFSNAEAALSKAKSQGEHYLFYQREMNAKVAETLLLENKMRRALDREQFVLYYQPKIDLVSRRMCGLEALIRWNDPDSGVVPPIRFIPLLEETGMILEVGRWAMQKAVEDYRDWCAEGRQPPRIAVNVSPIQLRQKDFVDVVRHVIQSVPNGAAALDLEITESVIMEDMEGNIEKLRAIREMGVNLAIDDFGTGYSSLRYLAKLPVNALKIDRSFIITMVNEPDDMSIVATIISLAHSLNLKVIAEGVETEEQSEMLNLLQCDQAQGYLFSKPVPPEQLESQLEAKAEAAAP